MISSIIFSKDRPLQLDLTLRTLKKNFSQCNSNIIIYKATTPEFQQSYTQLISEHTDCLFKHQGGNFFKDCLDALFQPKSHYYCLLTDDIIFFDMSKTLRQCSTTTIFIVRCSNFAQHTWVCRRIYGKFLL